MSGKALLQSGMQIALPERFFSCCRYQSYLILIQRILHKAEIDDTEANQ